MEKGRSFIMFALVQRVVRENSNAFFSRVSRRYVSLSGDDNILIFVRTFFDFFFKRSSGYGQVAFRFFYFRNRYINYFAYVVNLCVVSAGTNAYVDRACTRFVNQGNFGTRWAFMTRNNDLFVRFSQGPFPIFVVFRSRQFSALSRQSVFLSRRAISLLYFQGIRLCVYNDRVIVNDPMDVPTFIYYNFNERLSSSFVQNFKASTNGRVIYRLLLCVLTRICYVNQVSQISRAITIGKRIGRRNNIISRTPMVGIHWLLCNFCPIIFFQVVRPSQASKSIAFYQCPLITINVSMLRFTVFQVAQVRFAYARR